MALVLGLLGFGKTVLGFVGKLIGGVARWAGEDLRNALILMLVAALVWAGFAAHAMRADRDDWQRIAGKFQTAAEKALHAAEAWQRAHGKLVDDVKAKRKAAAEADRLHAAQVARQLYHIRERTADDYQARLADTRLALERVRDQLARAEAAAGDPGGGGGAAVPAALTARCRAFGAADCDALLAALPGQLAAAEGNTARLIALQDYVRSMLAIDFSGEGGRQ